MSYAGAHEFDPRRRRSSARPVPPPPRADGFFFAGLALFALWVAMITVFVSLLTGCPRAEEPVANARPTGYPQEIPIRQDTTAEALREATPDDSKFPYDLYDDGPGCPDEDDDEPLDAGD